MEAVLAWIKNFLLLYFLLTLILYLVPKESYRKYMQFAAKMILMVVLFLPLLDKISSEENFFALIEEMGNYREDEHEIQIEEWEELQDEYVKERSGYYQKHFGESE